MWRNKHAANCRRKTRRKHDWTSLLRSAIFCTFFAGWSYCMHPWCTLHTYVYHAYVMAMMIATEWDNVGNASKKGVCVLQGWSVAGLRCYRLGGQEWMYVCMFSLKKRWSCIVERCERRRYNRVDGRWSCAVGLLHVKNAHLQFQPVAFGNEGDS